jgi:UDP-MurNAc hydroxylase
MRITYLGHAGFIVETNDVLVIMDPWLSPTGAFDSSWFQMPRNHHLAPLVYEKLRDPQRSIYLYISHEHQDHFDVEFLNSLPVRRFSLLVPEFSRSALAEHFSGYECKELIFFRHRQEINIPGGSLKVYVDDSWANRDSAILMKAGDTAFLNMNDCKLFDALHEIVQEDGPIKIFACQFSGATWHPTCYDYPITEYEAISTRKSMAKFESVAKAIELVHPAVYIPSAGPVCFLDPMLFHLNTQRVNIFPRATKFINYIKRRLPGTPMSVPEMMPGDVLDAASCSVTSCGQERLLEEQALTYIADYAASYRGYFEERAAVHERVDEEETIEALRVELEQKLAQLSLADRVTVPLYFRLGESGKRMLRVDFAHRSVDYVSANRDSKYYEIVAPAWQIRKILARELTWEEFSLTFRLRLKRDPDVYDPVLHAFLIMEVEDIGSYCDLLLQIEAQEQRIIVEAEGKKFSVRRYCPHQGGDLSCGWIEDGRFLTCPRHRWRFDLFRGGRCTTNATDIGAVCLETNGLQAHEGVPDESLSCSELEAESPIGGRIVS